MSNSFENPELMIMVHHRAYQSIMQKRIGNIVPGFTQVAESPNSNMITFGYNDEQIAMVNTYEGVDGVVNATQNFIAKGGKYLVNIGSCGAFVWHPEVAIGAEAVLQGDVVIPSASSRTKVTKEILPLDQKVEVHPAVYEILMDQVLNQNDDLINTTTQRGGWGGCFDIHHGYSASTTSMYYPFPSNDVAQEAVGKPGRIMIAEQEVEAVLGLAQKSQGALRAGAICYVTDLMYDGPWQDTMNNYWDNTFAKFGFGYIREVANSNCYEPLKAELIVAASQALVKMKEHFSGTRKNSLRRIFTGLSSKFLADKPILRHPIALAITVDSTLLLNGAQDYDIHPVHGGVNITRKNALGREETTKIKGSYQK